MPSLLPVAPPAPSLFTQLTQSLLVLARPINLYRTSFQTENCDQARIFDAANRRRCASVADEMYLTIAITSHGNDNACASGTVRSTIGVRFPASVALREDFPTSIIADAFSSRFSLGRSERQHNWRFRYMKIILFALQVFFPTNTGNKKDTNGVKGTQPKSVYLKNMKKLDLANIT